MSADEDLFAQRRAEVLRLTYAENLGIRAISRSVGSSWRGRRYAGCSMATA
jgi:hypothetical protein